MHKNAYNLWSFLLYSASSPFSSSISCHSIQGFKGLPISETPWICEIFGYFLRKEPIMNNSNMPNSMLENEVKANK